MTCSIIYLEHERAGIYLWPGLIPNVDSLPLMQWGPW